MTQSEKEKIFKVLREHAKDLNPIRSKGLYKTVLVPFFKHTAIIIFALLATLIIHYLKQHPKAGDLAAQLIAVIIILMVIFFIKKKDMENYVDYRLRNDSKKFTQKRLREELSNFNRVDLKETIDTLGLSLKSKHYFAVFLGLAATLGWPFYYFAEDLKPLIFSQLLITYSIAFYAITIFLIVFWTYQLTMKYTFFIKTIENVIEIKKHEFEDNMVSK